MPISLAPGLLSWDLTWLADAFRTEGVTVVEDPGWKTRGRNWNGENGNPDGGIEHHTAPPVPYPTDALNGTRDGNIRCNWTIRPDGTVIVIAAGACNYSAGSGSGVVHAEVKAEIAPSGTAAQRNLPDTMNGNSYYLNDELQHAGDGGPLPEAQRAASTLCWTAVCRRMGWDPNRVIAHGEHSARKIDPRWDGKDSHQNCNALRADVRAALGGQPPTPGGDDMFRRGDKGPDIVELQKALEVAGYPLPTFGADGDYGQETADAVTALKLEEEYDGDGDSLRDAWAARLFDLAVPAPPVNGTVDLDAIADAMIEELQLNSKLLRRRT